MSCRIYRARMTGRVRGTPRERPDLLTQKYIRSRKHIAEGVAESYAIAAAHEGAYESEVKLHDGSSTFTSAKRVAEGEGKEERAMRILLCANYMRLGDIAAELAST